MCDSCGCGQPGQIPRIIKPGENDGEQNHGHTHTHSHSHDGHEHSHAHQHSHNHDLEHDTPHNHNHEHNPDHDHDSYDHDHSRRIEIERDALTKNNLLAERNRGFFEAKGVVSINLVSSPGSGKTSLLERTIKDLQHEMLFFIIEGDQQTMNDAMRIQKTGVPVVQVNTGSGCHLDADMVNKAAKKLEIGDDSVLFIENVGNLICPAMFDLGESARVVIISTTEGDDKPVKYPYMFQTSDLCIINKTDLLPYVDFNPETAKSYARQVNHHLPFIELSVKTGEGIEKWYEWLRTRAGG